MNSSMVDFLLTTGRTLSQMALYSPAHPTVKGAIEEAHGYLTTLLEGSEEITIYLEDGSILVNGQIPKGVPDSALRPFISLFSAFNLFSLTFKKDIDASELVPFFELAYDKNLRQTKVELDEFFHSRGAPHIQTNQAKYAKIRDDETVGAPEKETETEEGEKEFLSQLENLPLDDFLKTLIQKAVKNPQDRERILSRVTSLIKKEISEVVRRETKALEEQKIKATNERDRVENVVGTMAEGVVVVDGSGKVLMMNSTAEEMYGVQLGECLGRPLWEGVRREQMVALAKETTVPTDGPLVKEVELRADEATKKTLRSSAAAIQDPEGRVIGMVSVLSDVTKQKELTRMQNEFMANVTHDLRAPIHALKLAVSAILEEAAGPVTPEQNKMLSLAGKNVDRLTRLIDDLLDFSAIETGKLRLQPAIIKAPPLLQDSVQSFEAWAKSRGVSLTLDVPEDLLPVYADTDRVLQILNNLLSNAIKFTPSGGTVSLSAENQIEGSKRFVKFIVTDSGKGVGKEDQRRIFKRFVQLQNQEKLDVRGTGLGLSICQALIHQHKGDMGLVSPVPQQKNGSQFWFTIPAVEPGEETMKAAPGERLPQEGALKKPPQSGFWKKIMSRLRLPLALLIFIPSFAFARPYSGVVRRVLEGDKLQLQDGNVVRFLGIDLPRKTSPYHVEAAAASRSWVKGKNVRLRYGLQERSVDGLWQAYVFADGVFVNAELVREGYALVTRLDNEEEYLKDLLKAERFAIRKKRGLWRDSTIDPYNIRIQKPDVNPWATDEEIRRGKISNESQNENAEEAP